MRTRTTLDPGSAPAPPPPSSRTTAERAAARRRRRRRARQLVREARRVLTGSLVLISLLCAGTVVLALVLRAVLGAVNPGMP